MQYCIVLDFVSDLCGIIVNARSHKTFNPRSAQGIISFSAHFNFDKTWITNSVFVALPKKFLREVVGSRLSSELNGLFFILWTWRFYMALLHEKLNKSVIN